MNMAFSRIQARLPTNKRDIKTALQVIRLILLIPQYTFLCLISSFLGLSIFVLSQNTQLVQTILFGEYLTIDQRFTVLSQLYPILGTAFTPAKEVFLLTCSLLFGINLSMAIYHMREHQLGVQSGTGSAIGMIFGTLGAGCAACGSVVLTGLLSFLWCSECTNTSSVRWSFILCSISARVLTLHLLDSEWNAWWYG